jgi:hypothetical protein
VNDDGVSTSDAESQEALVADDETDSSLGIVNEAEIEEGYKEEVISDSTIEVALEFDADDPPYVPGTADEEVESGEESEEGDELPAE